MDSEKRIKKFGIALLFGLGVFLISLGIGVYQVAINIEPTNLLFSFILASGVVVLVFAILIMWTLLTSFFDTKGRHW